MCYYFCVSDPRNIFGAEAGVGEKWEGSMEEVTGELGFT